MADCRAKACAKRASGWALLAEATIQRVYLPTPGPHNPCREHACQGPGCRRHKTRACHTARIYLGAIESYPCRLVHLPRPDDSPRSMSTHLAIPRRTHFRVYEPDDRAVLATSVAQFVNWNHRSPISTALPTGRLADAVFSDASQARTSVQFYQGLEAGTTGQGVWRSDLSGRAVLAASI